MNVKCVHVCDNAQNPFVDECTLQMKITSVVNVIVKRRTNQPNEKKKSFRKHMKTIDKPIVEISISTIEENADIYCILKTTIAHVRFTNTIGIVIASSHFN